MFISKTARTGVLALAAMLFAASPARAHHGMDFLTVQGYEIPGTLGAYLFTDLEWERTDGDNGYGIEPGLLVGLFPRTALEVQTSFGKESGGDWRYQSVTPSLLFQLTPPDADFPLRVAVSAGYQFADEEGEEHHHEEGGGHHEEEGDHHADEEEGHSHHGGHQHGVDGFQGRVIFEYETGDWLFGTNFIVETDEEDQAAFGYSAGVRYRVCKGFATGVEAEGEFDNDSSHELIAGFYVEPIHAAVIKVGVGFGLTEESPDFSLRTGLVWKF